FEKEFAEWMGVKHALAFQNGTASLNAAMWACGVGAGDEVIAPSMTYWASCAGALTLGATVNFADIEKDTLCIDPNDIEHRIGPRTKAIIAVHYAGHPCPMDEIMAIAKKHNIKVIEDTSHAQGSLYKGRLCGSIGDVGAMSMMAGKSFAIGEGGMLVTNSREIYERAISFAHYERTGAPSRFNAPDNQITLEELAPFRGIPQGAMKGRMNQTCSAMGRVQLKYYPQRIQEIQDSINYFWDLLKDVPGLHPHRPDMWENSTMGGWYYAQALYRAEELGGVNSDLFSRAMNAEGVKNTAPGGNSPLHIHPYFTQSDLFRLGKPTAIAFGQRDVRQKQGDLPVSESIHDICIAIPWFKHFDKPVIKMYADAFRKVAENAEQLKGVN
ncbi:MAG: DegT/DnrJ/EryC1/StrS family aminotransferase, partial [Sphaerochaetaceae bacterium]|nr:DegT/DnrJ/EryC1/StrS family aminotransferase [Sphaerochaetaceae bacterium]